MTSMAMHATTDQRALWVRCADETCGSVQYVKQFRNNLQVCDRCSHHARLSAHDRVEQITDTDSFEPQDDLTAVDPLQFEAAGRVYRERLVDAQQQTGLLEAALSGSATIDGYAVELVVLEFGFLGASMGSAVGEKIARAADRALERRVPLVTVSASGGARMHEGIYSLMQMARTVTALAHLGEAGIPHIAVLTDPTLGGVTASYAGIGDVIVVEQGALVGFAGPRIIEQITKQKLPPEAQRAAFLLEHGMVDLVVPRRELRPVLAHLLRLYTLMRPRLLDLPATAPGVRERAA